MELVSVLAGERWSDRPRCVCPVLAAMARVVNDRVSSEARQRLALDAPTFVGTAQVGSAVGPTVAREVQLTALGYVVDDDARFPLLVGLAAFDRIVGTDSAAALTRYPALAARAQEFVDSCRVAERGYLRRGLPAATAAAVQAIADGAGDDTDEVLLGLLRKTLQDYSSARAGEATASTLRTGT